MNYALAPNGVFRTIQGEGHLIGMPMVFVRLAGCSIGCSLCDTDYSFGQRVSDEDIANRCIQLVPNLPHKWVWITGGEPMDRDLLPLIKALRDRKLFVALATSGNKQVPTSPGYESFVDFLSVSPHEPSLWVQRTGDELKLIPGLKGHHLLAFESELNQLGVAFGYKYVIPCDGKPDTVLECQQWVETHPTWLMGVQAHKCWNLP